MDDLKSLGGNEARDRLRPACVYLKGDHDGRFLVELTSDPQELVGRGAKGRILEVRRAAHVGRDGGGPTVQVGGAHGVLWLRMTDSEIEITEELVHGLLKDQHPDLAGLPIREVAGGWGNQMWRLGDELAVRMPRMEGTPDLLRKECRWLPVLAPRLPLPVPTPVRIGEPSARFPRPWSIMTWVRGEPLDYTSISRGDHAADTLAGFLRALHVEAPAEAPASSDRGAHPKKCTGDFEKFLQAIAPGGFANDVRAVWDVWDDAVAAPDWEGPPVWLHGDLHPANVVVSDGTLSGVIDFDAMFAGDPAWDLAAAWVLLPAGAGPRFFEVYAHADEATIRRARGLAAMKSLFLILMGQNGERGLPGGKPAWGPAGRAALDRVLTSSSGRPSPA